MNPEFSETDSLVADTLKVEIAPGELIDKITILEIKLERIEDTAKLANVRAEWETLCKSRDTHLENSAELTRLSEELKTVNQQLWQIEDDIRECERGSDFGPTFVELARSVYFKNDTRATLKREISTQLGSHLVEEKSYAAY